jgi:hypothetical protein
MTKSYIFRTMAAFFTIIYLDMTGHFDNTLYDNAWLKKNCTPVYTNYENMPLYYRHGK